MQLTPITDREVRSRQTLAALCLFKNLTKDNELVRRCTVLSVIAPPCVIRVTLDLRCFSDNHVHKANVYEDLQLKVRVNLTAIGPIVS